MASATNYPPRDRTAEDEARKARDRREQAAVVQGLLSILSPEEQLLGFLRGVIAGGLRGKLAIGPEAFFAPHVNLGLTDRRFVVQHIHPENDRPSEIEPHFFSLSEIASIDFSDADTFGQEPAGRLNMRLHGELPVRFRISGTTNCQNARALVTVFQSLMRLQQAETTPVRRRCPFCQHILDQPFRYCPYCGGRIEGADLSPAPAGSLQETREPVGSGATEPVALDTGVMPVSVPPLDTEQPIFPESGEAGPLSPNPAQSPDADTPVPAPDSQGLDPGGAHDTPQGNSDTTPPPSYPWQGGTWIHDSNT
ncbi:MAG: hypothetical protein RMJ43_03460 [Chloroherpetonaceae bacterium]|nr:hypothetical protein [Chthonomonadaceae bacterium]MDW8206869.1 hypothetical protein [Chloroherpetonaceae bacterium]